MTDLVSHFMSNGAVELSHFEAGEGFPFVLVHGFTGSKLDFSDQLNWFADQRRVIAVDQRGHGESANNGPYTLSTLVDDLIAFVDHLDVPQFDLLGHSMGGMVAMRATLQHPERVRSLVLMDTASAPVAGLLDRSNLESLAPLIRADGCEAMLPLMRSTQPTEAQQRGIDTLGEEEHWRRIAVKLSQMDPEAFIALAQELGNHENMTSELADIGVPTTILVGEHDVPFVEPSTAMRSAITNSQLVSIPDAGHCPQYENPDAWRAAIDAHLARLTPVK
jgi:pimeloyl-ACP methyl ester carboxylesterase